MSKKTSFEVIMKRSHYTSYFIEVETEEDAEVLVKDGNGTFGADWESLEEEVYAVLCPPKSFSSNKL
ncbi:hypothetical protein HYS94_02050 [Candidatus Daviesbacteria bacterium]|nr:hypothetical protein [Candidatus Daviesbacteria bacterium]